MELDAVHVVLAYVPNSGRDGRLDFRLHEWEPSIVRLLKTLSATGKPLLYHLKVKQKAHRFLLAMSIMSADREAAGRHAFSHATTHISTQCPTLSRR